MTFHLQLAKLCSTENSLAVIHLHVCYALIGVYYRPHLDYQRISAISYVRIFAYHYDLGNYYLGVLYAIPSIMEKPNRAIRARFHVILNDVIVIFHFSQHSLIWSLPPKKTSNVSSVSSRVLR